MLLSLAYMHGIKLR